jgi:hypothetical protein
VVSSPVVSLRFAIPPASRRVYTLALALITGIATLGIGCHAPAPSAHDRFLGETPMSKGPATAAVTIVEFSDYQ